MVNFFFPPAVLGFFDHCVASFQYFFTRPFGTASSCRDTSKSEEKWGTKKSKFVTPWWWSRWVLIKTYSDQNNLFEPKMSLVGIYTHCGVCRGYREHHYTCCSAYIAFLWCLFVGFVTPTATSDTNFLRFSNSFFFKVCTYFWILMPQS